MNKVLTEDQKRYIKEKFIDPLIPDLESVPRFQGLERAKLMLETSMKRLLAAVNDKEHKANIFITKLTEDKCVAVAQVTRKDCDDFVEYRQPFNLLA